MRCPHCKKFIKIDIKLKKGDDLDETLEMASENAIQWYASMKGFQIYQDAMNKAIGGKK